MLSMALDPFQNWIALGTSLGYHVVWDMRFQLPICNWKHEGHGRRKYMYILIFINLKSFSLLPSSPSFSSPLLLSLLFLPSPPLLLFLPSPPLPLLFSSAYVHRIQQLSAHPNQLQTLISAASGNNEISVWDMETATRRQMIWASPVQPFGHMTENVSCV